VATSKNTEGWKEAKKRCRLNEADIQMAKELGLTPKSLLKNILHLIRNGKRQYICGFEICMKVSLEKE